MFDQRMIAAYAHPDRHRGKTMIAVSCMFGCGRRPPGRALCGGTLTPYKPGTSEPPPKLHRNQGDSATTRC
jgi:hypothetical protein